MQVTFIRHLPTEWNRKTLLQGRRDIGISPVSAKEMEGIQANKKKLEVLEPFDSILASTLKRTQETAWLYGRKPEIERLLDELDFGPFEGTPKEKMFETLGTEWMDHPLSITLGEPVRDLEKRVISFINKYQSSENVLVFGHGVWIRAALSYLECGNINKMNKKEVKNNDCLTVHI